MIRSELLCNRIIRCICIAVIGLFVLIDASPTYAIDDRYVGESKYWYESDFKNVNCDDFNGILRYHTDNEEGCVYFYLFYNYPRSKEVQKNDILLSIEISNSLNNYRITANHDSVVYANGDEIDKNIIVKHDFSNIDSLSGSGHLYIAVQLQNKDDRKLKNTIRCQYSVAEDKVIDLINNVSLDMTPATTAKTTKPITTKVTTSKSSTNSSASKSTTTKQSTTAESKTKTNGTEKHGKSDTHKDIYDDTNKSTKVGKVTVTKFVPKPISSGGKHKKDISTSKASKSKDNNTTVSKKFKPAQTVTVSEIIDETTTELSDEEFFTVLNTTQPPANKEVNSDMSMPAKLSIITAAAAFSLGVALVVIGISKGKYKIARIDSKDDNKESNDE